MQFQTRPLRSVIVNLVVAAVLLLAAFRAVAQTITVDLADADVIDINPDTGTVADLPGPDGHVSFSEAMIASNNTPGRQTVGFAIPTSEWDYLPWYYPGRAVITGMMFYANAYDAVTIDGRTQTAFTGDTNPDGREVVILRGGGLYLAADHCTVMGLDRTSLYVEGSHGLIEDNSEMGIDIYGGAGGSGTVVRGNTGGGYVQIDQSNDNIVIGNTVNRVRVLGWIAGGRPATNNRIGGPGLSDRNRIVGQGTWNSEGIPGGFAVQLFDSVGTVIENNQIGTTPDGMAQGHLATTAGILFENENHATVIRGNRIAGILGQAHPPHGPSYVVGSAIQIGGTGTNIRISANVIGLNANGEPVLGSVTGITTQNYYLGPVQGIVIGGPGAGEGNEIAGNLQTGISVANACTGVRISGNSMHDNGVLGIDLITGSFAGGVTPNDALDADSGGNGLQNFPVLGSAESAGAGTTVTGTLNSLANEAFTIEFFASSSCGPAGYGEGGMFLGAASVSTDGSGNAPFSATLPIGAPPGWVITATSTQEASGNTSEFSACIPLVGGWCPSDFDRSGFVDTEDFDAFVRAFEAGTDDADFDASGFVDLEDFASFVMAFEEGC